MPSIGPINHYPPHTMNHFFEPFLYFRIQKCAFVLRNNHKIFTAKAKITLVMFIQHKTRKYGSYYDDMVRKWYKFYGLWLRKKKLGSESYMYYVFFEDWKVKRTSSLIEWEFYVKVWKNTLLRRFVWSVKSSFYQFYIYTNTLYLVHG